MPLYVLHFSSKACSEETGWTEYDQLALQLIASEDLSGFTGDMYDDLSRFKQDLEGSTQAVLDYYGVSEASAVARDNGGVLINGTDMIDANKWYTAAAGGNVVPQYYIYSATNVRLQEASVGYTFPRKMLNNVCELTLQLVGRNLWMIYNKAPFDPEAIATTGNYYQGIDYFMMPNTRNFGFNIRIKF